MDATRRRGVAGYDNEAEDISRIDVELSKHAITWMLRRHIPFSELLRVIYGDNVKAPGKHPGTYSYSPDGDKEGPEVIAKDEGCRSGGAKRKIITVHDRK